MAFLKKLFRKNETALHSKYAAKERLKLVLVQDRMNIDSDALEGLKNDLIDVIDRHLDIDKKAMDVSFCREGNSVAIVANIPVMKEPRRAV
ncbi:MAG: cell division topological specificity factor MinE [Firmicutes bacterium]|nr:cell division topological specificity factor MinE [Bacillota bacterium]MBQ4092060.1 cell division topological specificity factor MinE [Bacillota bacterium]